MGSREGMRKNELRYRKGGVRLSFELKTLRESAGSQVKEVSVPAREAKKHFGKVNAMV